ncbi:hypothetical protein CO230_08680 [Chryseobacterium sp. 6424]|uniref:hypothetical protein n=1 Tax=Chryseobacterium sp. 6424 TaxID=2039166 RepID=UPI000EFB727D|nr:hypothetical protein [Chryseobacterium sp. 6424]AYO58189.1 hypothetical protein CO230_08680 [Chryseobacterium sp. 6424]
MSTFNSKEYSWADVSTVIGGRILEGITGIEYTIKQDKEVIFGRGNEGHSIGRGNKTADGKLSVLQSEYEAMVRDAKDNDILNLNIDITVSYVPKDAGPIVTDILKSVEFTEDAKKANQGDKNMVVELPFIFLKKLAQK